MLLTSFIRLVTLHVELLNYKWLCRHMGRMLLQQKCLLCLVRWKHGRCKRRFSLMFCVLCCNSIWRLGKRVLDKFCTSFFFWILSTRMRRDFFILICVIFCTAAVLIQIQIQFIELVARRLKISVTRGWQQMMNVIRWMKQVACICCVFILVRSLGCVFVRV